jgi:hypothetical protein
MDQKYLKFVLYTNALAFSAHILAHPYERVEPMPSKVFPPDQSRVNVTVVSTSTSSAGISI